VISLPGSENQPTALAGERKTGRILKVTANTEPVEVARIPVEENGDGGLTAIALSPTYAEDHLIFAYITTPTDNRVVRIAAGDQPKPILTGIPRGANGNRGALLVDGKGALFVATGDGGNPSEAANADSLAGKILRVDAGGKPATGNPRPDSPVFASGLHNPGGLCRSADDARLWATDRTSAQDVLYRVQSGVSLSAPVWTWPDKPGLAGCVDNQNTVTIAASIAGNLQNLPITPQGAAGGSPSSTMDGKNGISYGRLAGVDPINDDFMFVGTVNKDGGKTVSSDDRVVILPRKSQSGGSGGKD
jgi:glucose/arabinose dehydrogenase